MKPFFLLLTVIACNHTPVQKNDSSLASQSPAARAVSDSIVPAQYANGKLITLEKNNAQWEKELNELEYYVLRQEGTERAFSGDLWDHHEHGTYICRGCGLPLFASETKFNSGTGWPSFFKPIVPDCIRGIVDNSHGMSRLEVECARCGGHLGHVFNDGPAPTGLRYCMNSVSLDFVKE
ncbi:MAG: peptide-methionine (R)-S-oxide reductase MsrB [Saprospiraceae bacterium]|nr:peptide-methionine (R)-S-oxide reductase MsrB [Saprospiraceae bacterium]